MPPIIIDIDEYKSYFEGYVPAHSEDFQSSSAQLANKEFNKIIKDSSYQDVVLMCGGSASGKSEFVEEYAEDADVIIFDSTLSNENGAKVKIRNILRKKKKIIVCFIFPKNLRDAFSAFQGRDRKIPEYIFYKTHAGARETVLWIVKNFKDIDVLIYESKKDEKIENRLKFTLFEFKSKNEKIDFLLSIQYTEEEIYKKLVS